MASTSSPNFWANLRDEVTGLAVDYARARYIDVETAQDDRNIPDRADLRYDGLFYSTGDGTKLAPGGLTPIGWAALGVALLGAVWLVRRVVR